MCSILCGMDSLPLAQAGHKSGLSKVTNQVHKETVTISVNRKDDWFAWAVWAVSLMVRLHPLGHIVSYIQSTATVRRYSMEVSLE
jgi:hypothetical protein